MMLPWDLILMILRKQKLPKSSRQYRILHHPWLCAFTYESAVSTTTSHPAKFGTREELVIQTQLFDCLSVDPYVTLAPTTIAYTPAPITDGCDLYTDDSPRCQHKLPHNLDISVCGVTQPLRLPLDQCHALAQPPRECRKRRSVLVKVMNDV